MFHVSVAECTEALKNIRDEVNPLEKPAFLSQLTIYLVDGTFKNHQVNKMEKETQFYVKRDFINAVLDNIYGR